MRKEKKGNSAEARKNRPVEDWMMAEKER